MPRSPSKISRQGENGGPNTPQGKAKASQNSAKHYLCSRQPLAPGEQAEELEQLKAGWLACYDTSNYAAKTLIDNLAECDWMRRRANYQYDRLMESLPEHMQQWDENQQAEHQRFTRYKTTWDRAFSRAYREAEQFRRSRRTEAREDRAEQAAAAAPKKREEAPKPAEPPPPAKPQPPSRVPQWAIVKIVDGVTDTRLHPPNDGMLRALANADPATTIFRFFEFPDGVPPEYHWTTADPVKRQTKGWKFDQKMRLDTWRNVIQREHQHLGPIDDTEPCALASETEPRP